MKMSHDENKNEVEYESSVDSFSIFDFSDIESTESEPAVRSNITNRGSEDINNSVEWEIEVSGGEDINNLQRHCDEILTNELDINSFSMRNAFLKIFCRFFLNELNHFYKSSIVALSNSEIKTRGMKKTRRMKIEENERIYQENEEKEYFRFDDFEEMKENLKRRFKISIEKDVQPTFWMKMIGSLFLYASMKKKNIKEAEEAIRREQELFNHLFNHRKLSGFLKLLFSPIVFGDKIVSDRIEKLFDCFNKSFSTFLLTCGVHYDELCLPIKNDMFPHRMKVEKPNPSGMLIHSASFFSGVIFHLNYHRRNHYKRNTPFWAKYLDLDNNEEKLNKKSANENRNKNINRNKTKNNTKTNQYSLPNLFSKFERYQGSTQYVILADCYYFSNGSIEKLTEFDYEFLIHCHGRRLMKEQKMLDSVTSRTSDLIISKRFNEKKVYLGKPNPRTKGVAMTERISKCKLTQILDFYQRNTRKVDTSNSLVIPEKSENHIDWSNRVVLFIFHQFAYNIWRQYNLLFSKLKRKDPRNRSLDSTQPLSFSNFLKALGISLLGFRSSLWSDFVSDLSNKHKEFFDEKYLKLSKNRNICSISSCGCGKKTRFYCSCCGKMCCINGIYSH